MSDGQRGRWPNVRAALAQAAQRARAERAAVIDGTPPAEAGPGVEPAAPGRGDPAADEAWDGASGRPQSAPPPAPPPAAPPAAPPTAPPAPPPAAPPTAPPAPPPAAPPTAPTRTPAGSPAESLNRGSTPSPRPAAGASQHGVGDEGNSVIPREQRRAPGQFDHGAEPVAKRRVLAAPFRTGLLVGLGVLVAYAVYLSLSTILTTLIVLAISAVIAIGLHPVVLAMVRHGVRRGIAVAITYLALLAFLVGAFYVIIPPIVQQVSAFATTLPDRLDSLLTNPTIKSLDDKFGLIDRVQNAVGDMGTGAATGVFTAAGVAIDVLVVMVLTLYFLAGLPRITQAAYRLVPASRRGEVERIGQMVIKQMGGYLGGATVIALQAGLVAGAFAWIIGLPYPLAIALGATVMDFVPVVGPVIIGVSMALLGFTQSLTIGIIAGAFYVCQHLFEAYWLYPRVMRRTVHISTAAVIVAIVVGAALLGVTGALLAVPVAAAVQLVMREVVLPRQDRS